MVSWYLLVPSESLQSWQMHFKAWALLFTHRFQFWKITPNSLNKHFLQDKSIKNRWNMMLCSTCFFEINFHTFSLKTTIFQDTIENVTFIFIRRSAICYKKKVCQKSMGNLPCYWRSASIVWALCWCCILGQASQRFPAFHLPFQKYSPIFPLEHGRTYFKACWFSAWWFYENNLFRSTYVAF